MVTAWKQQCEGFASYRVHDDGAIEVKDRGLISFDPNGAMGKKVVKIWQDFGPYIQEASAKYSVPIPWIVGIIMIESEGNPKACSPCVRELNGMQWCSLAPNNCGGNCCAYGLMQVIKMVITKECGMSMEEALTPKGNIMCGTLEYKGKLKVSLNDPVVAAKRYNGCGGCKGDKSPCNGKGIFGIGGQGDYATNFVKSVNTVVQMGVGKTTSLASSTVWLLLGAAAFAAYMVAREE